MSQTWPQLLVCRLLLGVGMGAKASSVPVFAAENAPASIRGALVMSWRASYRDLLFELLQLIMANKGFPI